MFEHIYQESFISSSFLAHHPAITFQNSPMAKYLAELTHEIDGHLSKRYPDEVILLQQLQQLTHILEDVPSHEIDQLLKEVNEQLKTIPTLPVRVDNEVWLARKNRPDGDFFFLASLKTIVCLN